MTVINYESLIDKAMHNIVKTSLLRIKDDKIPGNHHFYISFLTNHPKVSISPRLKQQYQDEMTIVLQHQFENFRVTDDYFSVTLSFGGIKEKLRVHFGALTAFADPSVKFGLQFKHASTDISETNESPIQTNNGDDAPVTDNVISFSKRRKS